MRGFGATETKKQRKKIMQTSMNQIHSPERAKAYFEDKLAFTTGPVELERWIKSAEDNLVIVDVREAEDFNKGHLPGAISIPRDQWQNPQGLSRDKTNVVYCYSQQCHLAANACVQFASKGFPVMEMDGGFSVWKQHELDIEETSPNRLKQQSTERFSSRH
jgi:rhodanese-related sulfurtransferase